jgi:hypothetical protein
MCSGYIYIQHSPAACCSLYAYKQRIISALMCSLCANVSWRLIELSKSKIESRPTHQPTTDGVRSRGCAAWLINRMRGTDALQPDCSELPEGNTGESISLSRANHSSTVNDSTLGGAAGAVIFMAALSMGRSILRAQGRLGNWHGRHKGSLQPAVDSLTHPPT